MADTLQIIVDSSEGKKGVDTLSEAINRLKQSSESAESSTDRLFSRMNSAFSSLGNAFRTFTSHVTGSGNAINGLTSGGGGGGFNGFISSLNSANGPLSQFGSALKQTEISALSLRNVLLGFAAVIGTFKLLSDAITRFQSFLSTMTAVNGSMQESRAEFAFLTQMANRLGVGVSDLTKNYGQLNAAAVGSGIAHKDLQRTYESFAIASRTLHLSGSETNLMFYAITQMVSKGTVSMEELRRQLGEKLPGAMNIAARSVGASMQDFEAAVKKGTVDSAKFLPIFAEAVRDTFKGGLSIAANALDAEMNRLKNTLQGMIVIFYDLGVAAGFTNILKEMNRLMSDKKVAEAFADVLKRISDQFALFLKGITQQDIQRWVNSFVAGMKEISNFITETMLPALKALADNFRIILEVYAIAKATSIGAAVGSAVPGIGTLLGGAIGLGTGIAGVAAGRGAFGNEGIGMGKGVTGTAPGRPYDPTTGTQRHQEVVNKQNAWKIYFDQLGLYMTEKDRLTILQTSDQELNELVKGLDFQNQKTVDEIRTRISKFFGPKAGHTLADVLKPSDKGETFSPLQQFISTLEQRLEGTGPMGSEYDALRRRLEDVVRKTSPKDRGLAGRATEIINQLEARGIEYQPLINRVESLLDQGNKDTPAILERLQTDLTIKYPNANPEIQKKLSELIGRFRDQYEGQKLVREANYRQERSLTEFGFTQEQQKVYQGLGNQEEAYNQQRQGLDLQADARERMLKKLELEKKLQEDIVRLRTEATQKGLDFNESGFKQNAERDVNAIIAALKRLQDYQKSAEYGVKSAITTYMTELENVASGVNQMVTSVFKGLEDAIVQFTMTGEINIRKLAQTFIEQLTRMYVQQQIMRPLVGTASDPGYLTQGITAAGGFLMNMFKGPGTGGGMTSAGLVNSASTVGLSGSASLLGVGLDIPAYASGGRIKRKAWVGEEGAELYIPSGRGLPDAKLVGVRGPEIFDPPGPGYIVPHDITEKIISGMATGFDQFSDAVVHRAAGGPVGYDSEQALPSIRRIAESQTTQNYAPQIKTEVNLHMDRSGSTSAQTSSSGDPDMKVVGQMIAAAVNMRVADMMRPGGPLYRGRNA